MYIKLLDNPGTSNFFLLYKNKAGIKIYLYINKRININIQEEISLFKNIYTIIIKFKGRNKVIGEKIIQILNIYNPSPSLIINNNLLNLLILKKKL